MPKFLKITLLFLGFLLLSPVVAICVLALFNGRVGITTDFSSSALLTSPPAPLSEALTLKVVTFNIQDLAWVSEERPRRMRGIGAALLILDPDIVGFQEAFVEGDREILLAELAHTRLKHHQYYPSGTGGSGLLIASAFPIKEVYFHRFSVANPFYRVWEGDWWAGKGVALARVELPDGRGFFDFYNTHAQADYGNPAYGIVRMQQMAELAEFVNGSQCATTPTFVVGDMNCRPGDEDFETAVKGAGLHRVMIGESRIDHIFSVENEGYTFRVVKTTPIDQTVKLGEKTLELSDHTGYMSEVEIVPVVSER
jgi:endonuclease/exonuclease/phosphatase family metal-dependent hydrolase